MYNNNRHPTISRLPLDASGPDGDDMDEVSNKESNINCTGGLLVFKGVMDQDTTALLFAAADLRMPLFCLCMSSSFVHLPTFLLSTLSSSSLRFYPNSFHVLLYSFYRCLCF